MDLNNDLHKTKRIGLALSGGGVRGVSHLGVISALTKHGITFSHISGTSAGAIAAAFFAAGLQPEDILQIIKDSKLFRLLRPSFARTGLMSILNVRSLINKYIPHNSFDKLNAHVTIAAVDLGLGKLVYLNDGELDLAVLASCCLPGIFRPIVINGHMYVDGGILNNFPVEPLVGNCDVIIGSSCNHLPIVNEIRSFGHLIDRAAMIAINANLGAHKDLCDVVIEPHSLGGYGIFDTEAAEEIFMIGYEEGLKAIKGNEVLKGLVEEAKQA
ncbi:patatin-like phospholipase family protein [Mucilaginibacter myungsuensis]|uniref:Patatin-like phospholipase family protein n=1 Tax=Mucilaginibacter myungsuensis TaxID=649104 RepID=A0A929KYA3_9SPHI|nr:patatin-like phospholipase family protein [Mucilaginibacter myungsuensis]MBE9663387.1 patatin-like phospholipase family protein [Mucilaginibacter myungsuensis]MDN3600124.1 patatin-like phospholipase family protein [Mucilaginibacter myungsuensis]